MGPSPQEDICRSHGLTEFGDHDVLVSEHSIGLSLGNCQWNTAALH